VIISTPRRSLGTGLFHAGTLAAFAAEWWPLSPQFDWPFSPEYASALVETILDSMTKALVTGDNIELRGFGSFTVRQYESYTGRNPKTGKEVEVKPKKLPFFKVGKDLKEAVMLGGRKCPS